MVHVTMEEYITPPKLHNFTYLASRNALVFECVTHKRRREDY